MDREKQIKSNLIGLLIAFREKEQLSQKFCTTHTGVNFAEMEANRRFPNSFNLDRLACFMGMETHELIRQITPPQDKEAMQFAREAQATYRIKKKSNV